MRDALSAFLEDQAEGIFRGPYLKVRTPFRQVDPATWESPLDWLPTGFAPYEHQATAFERLSSRGIEAAAADPGHDRHRVGQDRVLPLPDPRSLRPRAGRGQGRDQGADPLSDERAGHRPGRPHRRV